MFWKLPFCGFKFKNIEIAMSCVIPTLIQHIQNTLTHTIRHCLKKIHIYSLKIDVCWRIINSRTFKWLIQFSHDHLNRPPKNVMKHFQISWSDVNWFNFSHHHQSSNLLSNLLSKIQINGKKNVKTSFTIKLFVYNFSVFQS